MIDITGQTASFIIQQAPRAKYAVDPEITGLWPRHTLWASTRGAPFSDNGDTHGTRCEISARLTRRRFPVPASLDIPLAIDTDALTGGSRRCSATACCLSGKLSARR
jgi:hypothetical protein